MGKLESEIDTRTLILNEVQLMGSCGGTAQDIKDVYGYFATAKLKKKPHGISFEEIPEGLERLRPEEEKDRLVAVR
jgi:propanol-preferring alcohol dehydrogenase